MISPGKQIRTWRAHRCWTGAMLDVDFREGRLAEVRILGILRSSALSW
jgi:hypothetical protein